MGHNDRDCDEIQVHIRSKVEAGGANASVRGDVAHIVEE